MLRQKDKLVLKSDLLYRQCTNQLQDQPIYQFMLPMKYQQQALTACYDDVDHFRVERTNCLIKDQFYWPHLEWFYWPDMDEDIKKYVRSWSRCQWFKSRLEKAEMPPIVTTHALELIHMDFLTIEALNSDKDMNILVVMDHFIQFAQAFVTHLQVSSLIAKTLWDNFFMIYGFPERILSDEGHSFESNLIWEWCRLAQV